MHIITNSNTSAFCLKFGLRKVAMILQGNPKKTTNCKSWSKSMAANPLEYNILINDTDDKTIQLSTYYSWLNPFIKYLPIWVKHRSLSTSSKRRTICFQIILFITSLLILYRLSCKIWWNIAFSPDLVYTMVYVIYETNLTFSRFLAMYYFYNIFDYKLWISLVKKCEEYDNCCIDKIIRKYNKFLKIALSLMIAIGTINIVLSENQYEPRSTETFYIYSAVVVPICLFTVYYPMFVSVIIASTIFIKYHCHLRFLINTLDPDHTASSGCNDDTKSQNKAVDIDFKHIFEVYERIKIRFNHEYHKCFELSLVLYLGGMALDGWVNSYEVLNCAANDALIWYDLVWLAGDVFIIGVFVVTSSLVTEGFETFQRLLVDHGKIILNTDKDDKWYNYLLIYTRQNPLVITMGEVYITKLNALKFIIGFSIARALAYSVRYLDNAAY